MPRRGAYAVVPRLGGFLGVGGLSGLGGFLGVGGLSGLGGFLGVGGLSGLVRSARNLTMSRAHPRA